MCCQAVDQGILFYFSLSWTGTPGMQGTTPGRSSPTPTLGSRAPYPGPITATTTSRRTSRVAFSAQSSSPLGATPTRTVHPGAPPHRGVSVCSFAGLNSSSSSTERSCPRAVSRRNKTPCWFCRLCLVDPLSLILLASSCVFSSFSPALFSSLFSDITWGNECVLMYFFLSIESIPSVAFCIVGSMCLL